MNKEKEDMWEMTEEEMKEPIELTIIEIRKNKSNIKEIEEITEIITKLGWRIQEIEMPM